MLINARESEGGPVWSDPAEELLILINRHEDTEQHSRVSTLTRVTSELKQWKEVSSVTWAARGARIHQCGCV